MEVSKKEEDRGVKEVTGVKEENEEVVNLEVDP